ncbi:hypothetical protein OG592_00880 [Streptomyces avidinii]|uniref:hypothetical protein n=1 Tax=Streptomyces avidinii TaxID=1895 RepID=UPI003869C8EE|nr:hypothetical protein OG592_00880 [Streptomyces avidinii]
MNITRPWSRYGGNNYGTGTDTQELDSLSSHLEEAADSLECPAVATRDKPGLIDGALVWQSGIEPGQTDPWEPVTDQPPGTAGGGGPWPTHPSCHALQPTAPASCPDSGTPDAGCLPCCGNGHER